MILLTRFGWGKPVEFDSYNLKNPQRDTAIIALAGPLSNILIALVISLFIKAELLSQVWVISGLFQVLVINIVLAVFNLVPVHPLDGSKILMSFLPDDQATEYESFMNRYGMFVLIALIIPWNGSSPVSSLIWPIVNLIVNSLV